MESTILSSWFCAVVSHFCHTAFNYGKWVITLLTSSVPFGDPHVLGCLKGMYVSMLISHPALLTQHMMGNQTRKSAVITFAHSICDKQSCNFMVPLILRSLMPVWNPEWGPTIDKIGQHDIKVNEIAVWRWDQGFTIGRGKDWNYRCLSQMLRD